MIVFCLTVHQLWGRTLNKHHQDACAVEYADDRRYIKSKLSVALEALSDIKHVLKEDAGLALNFDKTNILVKGISAADAHAAAQRMLAGDPSLEQPSPLLSPASFVVDVYIGLGVPIGTDAFIQHFVKDKCEAIMKDVDKLDNIQDGFIHYQFIRFFQATRLQYLNCQIDLVNKNCLQQQHVDWKISNTLLKKGTREAYKTWTQRTVLGLTWGSMSRMKRAVSVSQTTPSPVTMPPTRPMPGLLPSWAPSHALFSRSGCQATTSRTPPPGMTPPSARSNASTGNSCSSTTVPRNPRRRPLAAAQPTTRAHTRSLPQDPRTTSTESS